MRSRKTQPIEDEEILERVLGALRSELGTLAVDEIGNWKAGGLEEITANRGVLLAAVVTAGASKRLELATRRLACLTWGLLAATCAIAILAGLTLATR